MAGCAIGSVHQATTGASADTPRHCAPGRGWLGCAPEADPRPAAATRGLAHRIARACNVVYHLLAERGLLGDGLDVEEYTGIHSWVDGLIRYTVVHSRTVAVLFADTRPVDAIPFHHDLLGADDPKGFFTVP
jgi:hypothetical protein